MSLALPIPIPLRLIHSVDVVCTAHSNSSMFIQCTIHLHHPIHKLCTLIGQTNLTTLPLVCITLCVMSMACSFYLLSILSSLLLSVVQYLCNLLQLNNTLLFARHDTARLVYCKDTQQFSSVASSDCNGSPFSHIPTYALTLAIGPAMLTTVTFSPPPLNITSPLQCEHHSPINVSFCNESFITITPHIASNHPLEAHHRPSSIMPSNPPFDFNSTVIGQINPTTI